MTARDLHRAEAAYRKATWAAEAARTHRNDLVRQALAEGWTHQAIADATGLTRSRVSQVKAAAA
jgi:hypothetical protein